MSENCSKRWQMFLDVRQQFYRTPGRTFLSIGIAEQVDEVQIPGVFLGKNHEI